MVRKISILFLIICIGLVFSPTGDARPLVDPNSEFEATPRQETGLIRRTSTETQSAERPGDQLTSRKYVNYEIRYTAPNADVVYMLWALNNWQTPDKSYWPPGSTAKKQYPYCKMRKNGEAFTLTLNLPEGAMLDYCFNVLAPSKGIDIWDTNGAVHRDYHSRIVSDGVAVIIAQNSPPAHKEEPSTAKPTPRPARLILPIATVLLAFAGVILLRRKSSKATSSEG